MPPKDFKKIADKPTDAEKKKIKCAALQLRRRRAAAVFTAAQHYARALAPAPRGCAAARRTAPPPCDAGSWLTRLCVCVSAGRTTRVRARGWLACTQLF
jgi:hypothetical protein